MAVRLAEAAGSGHVRRSGRGRVEGAARRRGRLARAPDGEAGRPARPRRRGTAAVGSSCRGPGPRAGPAARPAHPPAARSPPPEHLRRPAEPEPPLRRADGRRPLSRSRRGHRRNSSRPSTSARPGTSSSGTHATAAASLPATGSRPASVSVTVKSRMTKWYPGPMRSAQPSSGPQRTVEPGLLAHLALDGTRQGLARLDAPSRDGPAPRLRVACARCTRSSAPSRTATPPTATTGARRRRARPAVTPGCGAW